MMSSPESPDAGWCGDPRRGAAMGRGSAAPDHEHHRFSVRRVRLNGDYDEGGTYWGGGGGPLYYYAADDGTDGYLRASDRDHAIEQIREKHPNASFKRGASK
jgi:hypothetical protein